MRACSRQYEPDAYEEFKDCLLCSAASELAAAGRLGPLQALLGAHPCVLTPSLLDILGALPETLPVAAYQHLLKARPALACSAAGLPQEAECSC